MSLLKVTDKGIYCEQADVFIDPWKPVKKALITHAHADHSRKGHTSYIAQKLSVPIIKLRLGKIDITGVDYNESILVNGVKFSFHSAGHIIGSSQIRAEYKGQVWVASGDYKLGNDGFSGEIEIVKCHGFITESTFGIPAFNWTPQDLVMNQINEWWAKNKANGVISVIGAYSLGKAQRILQNVDDTIEEIYTHPAITNINKHIRASGVPVRQSKNLTAHTSSKHLIGKLVIAPPMATQSLKFKKFKPVSYAIASGWMSTRGARRRRGADKGFVLSDHADWDGLNEVVKETGAEQIVVTHGYTEIFSRWLREQGLNAYTADTVYEGDNLNTTEKEENEDLS